MNDLSVKVGKRIRQYRKEQLLSQEALAEKANLHPTYIGQLERGEKNATIESIEKVAVALGVPLSELFEKIDDRTEALPSYANQAYELVGTQEQNKQEQLIGIIKLIIHLIN